MRHRVIYEWDPYEAVYFYRPVRPGWEACFALMVFRDGRGVRPFNGVEQRTEDLDMHEPGIEGRKAESWA